jgi:CubicO group peptidase (beta-lactamase class C family)
MSETLSESRPLTPASPGELGFDAAALEAATAFAEVNETPWPRDLIEALGGGPLGPESYDELLGPVAPRGGPNGLVLRRGRVAATWGKVERADFTFSVAKSYLAVLAGLAVADGLIRDVHDPVRDYALDDGFEAAQNRDITWHHLLQQTSEWEGTLFDRPDLVDRNREVGHDGDNSAKGQHRDLEPPGSFWEYNDVRVNRLSLSLLQVFRRPLPEVLRERIMDPIGAGDGWVWHGYHNSTVEIDGRPMISVPGGTHWGGGIQINSLDHARLGQLILQEGTWEGRALLPAAWCRRMLSPCAVKPVYGYLWWLNTDRAYRPSAPAASVFASGAGGNIVWVDPSLDLVVVARWLDPARHDDFVGQIVASLK